jgi:hypothetical protein
MRNFTLALATATLFLTALALPGEATPSALSDGVYRGSGLPIMQSVQFYWSGRHYCWYDDGWHGPGYYWCGYRLREGFGWGGGIGWHGWGGAGHGGGHFGGGGHGGGHVGGGSHGGGHGGGSHGGGHGHGGGGHGGGHHH